MFLMQFLLVYWRNFRILKFLEGNIMSFSDNDLVSNVLSEFKTIWVLQLRPILRYSWLWYWPFVLYGQISYFYCTMVHWLIWCVAWQSLIRIPCMVGWLTTWPTRKVIVLEAAQIKTKTSCLWRWHLSVHTDAN